jgi:hypothetical protein
MVLIGNQKQSSGQDAREQGCDEMTEDEILARNQVATRVLGEQPPRWWMQHASECAFNAGAHCTCSEPVYFSNHRHIVSVDQTHWVEMESIH